MRNTKTVCKIKLCMHCPEIIAYYQGCHVCGRFWLHPILCTDALPIQLVGIQHVRSNRNNQVPIWFCCPQWVGGSYALDQSGVTQKGNIKQSLWFAGKISLNKLRATYRGAQRWPVLGSLSDEYDGKISKWHEIVCYLSDEWSPWLHLCSPPLPQGGGH